MGGKHVFGIESLEKLTKSGVSCVYLVKRGKSSIEKQAKSTSRWKLLLSKLSVGPPEL